MIKVFAFALLSVGLMAIAGCSKAPEIESRAAQSALETARFAGAEEYAPAAMSAAVDSLDAALEAKIAQDSKFSMFRRYGKSEQMFTRAKELADLAAAAAIQEKENVRQEVLTMLEMAKATLDSTALVIKNAPRGKGTRADVMLISNDLTASSAQLTEAREDFEDGSYLVAQAKVEAVVVRARQLMSEINRAIPAKSSN